MQYSFREFISKATALYILINRDQLGATQQCHFQEVLLVIYYSTHSVPLYPTIQYYLYYRTYSELYCRVVCTKRPIMMKLLRHHLESWSTKYSRSRHFIVQNVRPSRDDEKISRAWNCYVGNVATWRANFKPDIFLLNLEY